MKALVLGATGLVGGALVRQLSEAEHISEVIALSRRPIHTSLPKVRYVEVDFNQLSKELSEIKVDVLFSCLGTTKKTAGSIEAQRVVDYQYQLEAFESLLRNGLQHYLLVSASGASDKSPNAYLKMKGELEDEIKKVITSQGDLNTLHILQPSLLVGDREEFRLGESIAAKIAPWITWIPFLNKYRPIHVDEVAKKMVQLSSTALGQTQTHTLDEVFPK